MNNIIRNRTVNTDPQMKIRVPADLKQQIALSAQICGRTQNAEIVVRLRESFLEEKSSV